MRKIKIVVLDGYTENPGDISWEPLEKLGELIVYDRTSYSECPLIAERIGDADVAVVNETPVSKETIDRCPNLKAIAVLATGYNVVDYEYAGMKGIPVMNVPSYSTQIVSQFAVGMLLEICARYGHHSKTVHDGKWQNQEDYCYWDYPLIELDRKTAGIIGFGRIGQATARTLKTMGMRILATGSRPTEEGRALAEYTDTDNLLKQSDVVIMHCPLLPETREMINRETISKMKDGVIFINNSRGKLVVEQDLADALNSGKIYAAGLDVAATEPILADNPLLQAKNCLITPHMSWVSKEARLRLMHVTAENIRAWIDGDPVNVVNGE